MPVLPTGLVRDVYKRQDVNNLIKLLQEIGVKVTKHSRHDYTFQSDELKLDYLDSLESVSYTHLDVYKRQHRNGRRTRAGVQAG